MQRLKDSIIFTHMIIQITGSNSNIYRTMLKRESTTSIKTTNTNKLSKNIGYRIYDYNRLGLDGKPRQLHTQEAKDAIDYRVYPEYRTSYVMRRDAAVELVRCPYFTTELFELTREMEIPGGAGDDKGFLILIGIAGQVRLRTAQDETVLSAGEAVLVPAADGALSALPLPGEGGCGCARFLTTHL